MRQDIYRFRPMAADDLPLVRRWLETPHVSEWWGDPPDQLTLVTEDLDEPAMDQYIVRHHDVLIHCRLIEICSHERELLRRIAPPLADMWGFEPASHQRQVIRRHWAKPIDVLAHPSGAPQRLDGDVSIGVDADIGRDIERTAHDCFGIKRAISERARSRKRVVAARAD